MTGPRDRWVKRAARRGFALLGAFATSAATREKQENRDRKREHNVERASRYACEHDTRRRRSRRTLASFSSYVCPVCLPINSSVLFVYSFVHKKEERSFTTLYYMVKLLLFPPVRKKNENQEH